MSGEHDEIDGPDGLDETADVAEELDGDDPNGDEPTGSEDAGAKSEWAVPERGETLFYEEGGSKWIIAIGPVMLALTLALEIAGGGRIHWEVLTIFGVILIGFSIMQVVAARRHVSVRLTEETLRQGTRVIDLADIVKIYPENTGTEAQNWEAAPALGELHAVPRRRKGIGVKLADGKLAQAWARDVDRFRTELTEAQLAVAMGLPPTGASSTGA
ncbi:EbsA family protein [Gordonia sp. HY002]|uniref:EbsA family protein n=1 Tax=Gordonia zhenghanii TaxID=2911516 RepID=UPI001F30F7B4|nr:EbsA family protein [Gordonia zhenghanii]MCF8570049.1 EbsA family protein [Gordonia zhenghanii]